MIQRRKTFFYLAAVLALMPISLHANSGTPLMWATMLHMVLGNALIGIAEGALLASVFQLGKWRCIIAMIFANYLSAFCGSMILAQVQRFGADIHLYNAKIWFSRLVILTFLATLVAEWPFVVLAIKKVPGALKRSLLPHVIIQSLSYLVIFGWYSAASYQSIYTQFAPVPAEAMEPDEKGLIYYISNVDGNVYSCDLKGQNVKRRFELGSINPEDRLIVGNLRKDQWDLAARLDTDHREGKLVLLATNFVGKTTYDWYQEKDGETEKTILNFGDVPVLGKTNEWKFRTRYWPAEGITARSSKTDKVVRCAYETPLAQWHIRNAVQIAPEQVIFQLGADQICLLDLKTQQVALLVRGRGPVVAITPETVKQPTLRQTSVN